MTDLLNRELSEREREEVKVMKEWYRFVEKYSANVRFCDTLSHHDIETLKNFAKTNSKAGSLAKSMLYHDSGCHYNYHVEPEVPIFTSSDFADIAENTEETQSVSCNKVSVYPNPTETHTTFSYTFQQDVKNSILQIFDGKGRVILSVLLNGNSGNYVWDTHDISSGFYTYIIISDEKKLNGGKIIVQK